MKFEHIFFLVLFAVAVSVFLIHFHIVGSGIWGDGQYYFSYLRSIVLDGDLQMKNELEYFQRPLETTATVLTANKYSIGPAIFWFPFFLIAHISVILLQKSGFPIAADGYNYFYQIAIGISSVWYSIIGLWFCFLLCQKYFGRKNALVAVLTLWLGTNLFFYTAIDPINSHSISFFLASLGIYILSTRYKKELLKYILAGIIAGLLTVNRNQDIVVLLPLVLFSIRKIWQILVFLAVFIIICIPQFLIWILMYGQLNNPYIITGEKFFILAPFMMNVLFDSSYGLIYYAPILILSIGSWVLLLGKKRSMAIAACLAFFLQLYIVSSWHDWHGGASYGARMFISMMPYFIFGFAGFIHQMKLKKIILPFTIPVFIIVNWLFIIRFLYLQP